MIFSIARNRLLATVSTLTLMTSACGCEAALAAEPDHDQTLWIELGWQADNVSFSKRDLDLPLGPLISPSGLTAPLLQNLKTERSNDIDSKITYKPESSNWNFSASVSYGRSAGSGKIDQALAPIPTTSFVSFQKSFPNSGYIQRRNIKHVVASKVELSADTNNTEAHLIVDFDAGKDVGLGLFGSGSTSTLSAGVRFAHFEIARHASNFQETQGIHFQSSHTTNYYHTVVKIKRRELWNSISANGSISQNFSGIGPSIRWDASAQLWSDPRGGGVSLDWGASAAILFGKQAKTTHHQTTTSEQCVGYHCPNYHAAVIDSQVKSTKTITVPNVGGFAGLSLSTADAKISLGYRADFFFNAMDGGVDTRKDENRVFYGPYASISVGLAD